jgi:membrane protease YdiL (CAAX protease family)
MFAGAHTGALLSFPYFVIFGIVMAWMRWWSGTLALPMLMHFAHNLCISLHELAAS